MSKINTYTTGIYLWTYETDLPDGTIVGDDSDMGLVCAYQGKVISIIDLPKEIKLNKIKKNIFNKNTKVLDNKMVFKKKNKFSNGGSIKKNDLLVSNYVDFYRLLELGDGYFRVGKLNNKNELVSDTNIPYDFSKQSIYKKVNKEESDYFYNNLNLDEYKNGGNIEKLDWIDDGAIMTSEYKGEIITKFSDDDNLFMVGDDEFNSIEEAINHIDKNKPMSEKEINAYRHGAMKNGGSVKSENWLKSINEQRLNELKLQREKFIKEYPEDYIEEGGTRRNKQHIINDYDVNIAERERKFEDGGDVLHKKSYKDKIMDVLVDGKIHSDILKNIISRKPNYPREYIDGIILEKCFLIDYYRIK